VVLQAFIDESVDAATGTFVLGGCIATAESWAAFAKDWERLLPQAAMNKDGVYQFKMSEMARGDRMERVPLFFRAIENHILGFVSASINVGDLNRAIGRLLVHPNVKIDWFKYKNPWYVAFRVLMDKFHAERAMLNKVIDPDQKIDFFFDERHEKKVVIGTWDEYFRSRPDELKQYYGATPSFRDDTEFLPLQAADFWAWWVRKWTVEGVADARLSDLDFGPFKRNPDRKYFRAGIKLDGEDAIVGILKQGISDLLPRNYPYQIWDVKLV